VEVEDEPTEDVADEPESELTEDIPEKPEESETESTEESEDTIEVESNDDDDDDYYDCRYASNDEYRYYIDSEGDVTIESYIGNAESVAIPKTIDDYPVVAIGDYAFSDCESLTSITIPDSVTSIGDSAFEGCSNLTNITIPDSVTSIGDEAFRECSSLTSVTLPNSVTSIGDCTFIDCTSLTSIIIPNSVTSIGYMAFWGCSNLTSITIPNSVTSISNSVFDLCTSLTSIAVDSENSTYSSKDGVLYNKKQTVVICCPGGKSGDFTIPNSVTSINDWAFEGCSSLTSITIPNSVTSIGEGAFADCSSLTSVTIPDGVTSISDYAFDDCSSLTNITIPNSVTNIGYWAFGGCSSLTSITIPNSVTNIGEGAFFNCDSLTSITVPDSVTNIRENTFGLCTSLTSITIPDSVTSIGENAFYDCDNLTIYGYTGSYAETYAKEYDIPFVDLNHEHTWNDGEVTKKATCIATGVKTYTCTVCSTTKTESIAKDSSNHTGGTEVKNAVSATCGKAGYTGNTYCKGCGAKIKTGTTIPATGKHTWDSGKVTKNPSFTATGTKTYTCTVCGETKTETIAKLTKVALNKATVTLSKTSMAYTGKAQKPTVTVKVDGVNVPSSQYTVSYSNNTKVGTAKVTIKATSKATYVSGSVTKTFTITKATNPLTVSPTSKSFTVANCKKKAQTFTIKASKAQGTVSYKSSNTKYVTVSKGKVTVKKGTPKGTYKITVTAKGNGTYNSGSKTVTITVK
jgi:hypothetical protein